MPVAKANMPFKVFYDQHSSTPQGSRLLLDMRVLTNRGTIAASLKELEVCHMYSVFAFRKA